MRKQVFSWTTDGSGDATTGHSTSTVQSAILGRLEAIEYLPGTTDTGATVTVTCQGATAQTLLVKASAGTSNVMFYPRMLQHGNTDGAALTGTSGGDRARAVLNGAIKVVIASGGATKAGSLVVYFE
jgi:hypothetical protein